MALMELTLTKQDFFKQFKNRAIVVTDLPTGSSRNLAAQVNKTEGRGDATLRTRAEYAALFDLLDEEVDTQPGGGSLTLRGQVGNATEVGNLIETYLAASKGKDDVFDQPMYMVSIEDWPKSTLRPKIPSTRTAGRV